MRPRPTALINAAQEQAWRAQQRASTERSVKARRRSPSASEAEKRAALRDILSGVGSLATFAEAVLDDAEAHNGDVDINRVRGILRPGGRWLPEMDSDRISGHYATLCGAGLLKVTGRTTLSGDSGHNNGKPALTYAITAKGHRVLSAAADARRQREMDARAVEIDPHRAMPTDDNDDDRLFDLNLDGDER